jgi:hydroxymethylbilane synthase
MIKIGTRSSKLALYQSNLVKDKLSNIYPELDFLLIQIKTKGDKIQDRNLDRALDKGFFVKEIQEQLLKNKIDIAVHSLKDLPVENNPEIKTSAILERGNHKDVFISNKKKKLSEFTSDNKIGTSSLRRKAQLLSMNPKLRS